MKIKKLLALTLALIMALSCMSITAFANTTYSDDITISVTPEIGDTPATLISKAVLSDSTNLEITEARIFDTGYTSLDSIATSGTYNIAMTVKLKNYTEFAVSGGDYAGKFALKGLNCNLFDVCYGWDIDEEMPKTAPYDANHTTRSYLVFDGEITLYDATLDLDTTSDNKDVYSDSAKVAQNYTATVIENITNVTKVQVSWKLQDIDVTVTRNKIWNPETLTWDEDTTKTNGATASDPTAEFNFVNLSSIDVYAKVTFEKSEDIANEPNKAFTDNAETAGTSDGVIKLGNKATDGTTDNTGKVKIALTVTDSDFDAITSNTTGTYGTYTVTISANSCNPQLTHFFIMAVDAGGFMIISLDHDETTNKFSIDTDFPYAGQELAFDTDGNGLSNVQDCYDALEIIGKNHIFIPASSENFHLYTIEPGTSSDGYYFYPGKQGQTITEWYKVTYCGDISSHSIAAIE